MQDTIEKSLATSGRVLLALYFLVFGAQKIFTFDSMSTYMAGHGMVMVSFFLILTIFIQVGGGAALLLGIKQNLSHSFWRA